MSTAAAHVPHTMAMRAMLGRFDKVAVSSAAGAVEHVDGVKAPITFYDAVTTGKLCRDGLNRDVREADRSAAMPRDPGDS